MSQPLRKPVIGDCEFCSTKNTELYTQHNDLMCQACIDRENTLTHAKEIIVESRNIDSSIHIASDLAQSQTVPLVELEAAIQHDDSIPADQKDYVMAKECYARVVQFEQAIFEKRQEIIELTSKARVWQANAQNFAGKVKAEYREKLKQVDMNYQPVVKSIKPRSSGGSKNFKVSELRAAAEKYGLKMQQIQFTAQAHNLTAEGAAKYILQLIAENKAKKQQN